MSEPVPEPISEPVSQPFSLKISPIGKGSYSSKLNETVSEDDLAEGLWEINTNKLLEEVREEVLKQKKETGYIESEFTPIKKQQSTEWANRTPDSKVVSPNTSVQTGVSKSRRSRRSRKSRRSRQSQRSRQSKKSRRIIERNTSSKNNKYD